MRLLVRLILLILPAALACAAWAGPLDDLPKAKDYQSSRISSSDPWGGNGDGTQWNPMKPGEMRVLADIKGPGAISHIWFTLAPFNEQVLKGLILRMYWDNEKTPSVEVPIGEFFGLGHGKEYNFDSIPFEIGNKRGLNCFFQMPFKQRARITLGNQSKATVGALYYYIDYKKYPKPQDDLLYFHAQYRQSKPAVEKDNYTILDTTGRGHYVGVFYYVRGNEGGWWGEGDDMIYIDGDKKPTLAGTGTEDYFCHAWGMGAGQSGLRFGAPLYELAAKGEGNEDTCYRFHLEDAVTFTKSLKATIEHGHANDRRDDLATVAFWYQTEPHAAFPKLPSMEERRPWTVRMAELLENKKYDEYRSAHQELLKRAGWDNIKNDILLSIADSYRIEGNTDKAEETYKSMLSGIPQRNTAHKVLEALKAMGKDTTSLSSTRLFLVPSGDGHILPVQKDKQPCYRTDVKHGSPYIYFDVNDEWLQDTDQMVLLEIEYYNEGNPNDSFCVEYDSNFDGDEVAKRYHQSPVFVKPEGKGWKSAIIALESARFSNRQNDGADFRIAAMTDKDEFIKSIKIIPEQPPQGK